MPLTLDDVRQKHPEYKSWTDDELASGLYNKYYANQYSREDFDKLINFKTAQPLSEEARQRQEAGSVFRGVPILGAYEPQAGAFVSALAQPLTGAGEKGATLWDRYGSNLQKYQAESQQYQKEHPITEAVGEGVGGALSLGAAGMTGLGARALGTARGLNLPEMVTRGMVSMGAINAADTAARGGGLSDIGRSAAIGTATGAAGPVLGRLASLGIERVANMPGVSRVVRTFRDYRDPTGAAERQFGDIMQRGVPQPATGPRRLDAPLQPYEGAAARRMGLPVTFADIAGEPGAQAVSRISRISEDAGNTIRQIIEPRFNERQQRFTDYLTQRFNFPNAQAQEEALTRVRRVDNDANYRAAYQAGNYNLETDAELARLSMAPAVQAARARAVDTVRNETIRSGGVVLPQRPDFPNLRYWDAVRQELSGAAWRAGRGSAENRQLSDFARQINARLDDLVPAYRTARETSAGFKGAENALEAGQQWGKRIKGDPRELRRGFQTGGPRGGPMTPLQRRLFQDGYMDSLLNRVHNDPGILNKLAQSGAERERLQLVMGWHRANELETYLRVEFAMNATRNAVRGNREAIRQMLEIGLGITAAGASEYLNPMDFWRHPISAVLGVIASGAAFRRHRVQTRIINELAQMLMSNDPAVLQRGIQAIANQPQLLADFRAGTARMIDLGTRTIGRQEAEKLRPKRQRSKITEGQTPEYGGPQED